MKLFVDTLYAIAITLWVGGMWVIGFIVAPLLFARVPDRTLAAIVAGELFALVAFIGIACAAYLLVFRVVRFGTGCLTQGFFWVALLMLALTVAGAFGVQPVMESLRVQGWPREVLESVLRDRFLPWHGVASALYVIQSLLGVVLVVLQGRDRYLW